MLIALMLLQASVFDVNRDGKVDVLDVQAVVNAVLGISPCAACDVNHDGVVNVADLQAVMDAALGSVCIPGLPPGLTLSTAGVISGVPTSRGRYCFTVQVMDAAGVKATAPFSLTVN